MKYKKIHHTKYRDIDYKTKGYYKSDRHRVLTYRGLAVYYSKFGKKFYYFKNFMNDNDMGCDKEEFKKELKLRQSKIWETMYG